MKKEDLYKAASGADSTQAQEPEVKGFSSSYSNPNTCLDSDNEVEEFDLSDYKADLASDCAAVYVGTYHKYNLINSAAPHQCPNKFGIGFDLHDFCGSIFGMWLDIAKFDDYDEFLAVCRYLHRDEADPEFMAQDFQGFPRELYTEGFMSRKEFDKIHEIAELDSDEKEQFLAYMDMECSTDVTFDDCREAFCGEWDSEEDFTYNLVDEIGYLQGVPDNIANYFNYEAFSRDLFMCDYYFDGKFVWRRY